MKKLIKISSVLVALSSTLVPLVGLAADFAPAVEPVTPNNTFLENCGLGLNKAGDCVQSSTPDAVCCLINKISQITRIAFLFIITLSVLLLVWAAITFLRAGGDPAKITEGRNRLLWAIVGIAVAVIAFVIPGIVRTLVITK